MLKNWYSKNDIFTSGVLTFMVPSDSNHDPRIGERVQIEDVNAIFYAESVSHSWSYGAQLQSSVSITRGLNTYGGEIKLLNKIFKKGRFLSH